MRCDTLTAVTAPEHRVFICPLLGQRRGRLGPAKSGKSVSPGNRVRGEVVILDQWTHLPAHLSAAPARREERERAGAHPGRLTTRLWMSGWVWMPLQTDVTEADRPQTGGMRRWKHFTHASCCQTNKPLKYQESDVAATPCGNNKLLQQNEISTSQM